MPLQTSGMNDLPKKLLAHGTAVVNTTKQLVGSIGSAILITIMTIVTSSNSPDKGLAKTNAVLYKSGMLNAALKGVDITFICMIAMPLISLVLSLLIKEENQKI